MLLARSGPINKLEKTWPAPEVVAMPAARHCTS